MTNKSGAIASLLAVALLLTLAVPAVAQHDHHDHGTPSSIQVETLARTYGVNYELKTFEDHPDFLSSAPLHFSADGEFQGLPVSFVGDASSTNAGSTCSGPCNQVSHNSVNCDIFGSEEGSVAECAVRIVRFAQFGRINVPLGMDWQVVMVNDEGLLSGQLITRVGSQGELVYPAKVRLGGHMIVTAQVDGEQPVRLFSRDEPLFEGMAAQWPPYNLHLKLINPPIEYYLEQDLNDPTAEPFMVINQNDVRLGDRQSPFFEHKPQIQAVRHDAAGMRVEWSGTHHLNTTPNVTRYFVYRNDSPGDLNGWQKIGEVMAPQTSFVDPQPIQGPVAYVVSHGADYDFGYKYEGLFGEPYRVGRMPPMVDAIDPQFDH